jgi:hypothetical protein
MDYLGMLVNLTLDCKFETARIRQDPHDSVAILGKTTFPSPSQSGTVIQVAIFSEFGYVLVPRRYPKFHDLTAEWVRGYRGAWGLPKSTPTPRMTPSFVSAVDMAGGIAPWR